MQIESVVFKDSRSLGRGGAISAVGAVLQITRTRFVNCSSLGNGGGAISATNFICYGSSQVFNTAVNIIDSSFEACSSRGSGGAVVASSNLASITASASLFIDCKSESQGGAVASTDGGSAKLIDSQFVNNSANGFGGGALYAENAELILHGVSAHGNTAAAGGGGVLYWLGTLPPRVIPWCSEGKYPDPTSVCNPTSCSGSCLPCQIGTYLTGSGAQSQENCLPCEAGSYSSLLGTTFCLTCSAGSFSTIVGATDQSVCAACEPGYYVDIPSATTCIMCDIGTYSSEIGLSSCLLCHPGTFVSSRGARACVGCTGGLYSYIPGSISCQSCDFGYYSRPVASSCTRCSAGTYASAPGSTECESCMPGQFSNQGAEVCSVCWAGKFSSGIGMNSSQSCSACSDGLFSGRGAALCLPIQGFRAGIASNVFSDQNSDTQITLPLPYPFYYYGKEYSNVTVSTYGLLGMGECVLDNNYMILPSSYSDQNIVAIFWQNLAAPAGNGFIQWFDNDTITFQWTNWSIVPEWTGIGGSLTMQISLMRNGSLLLSYVELDGLMARGGTAIVGFQGGYRGVTISPNSVNSGLYSGLCYLVSPDPLQPSQYSVETYTCPDNMRLVESCGPGLFLGSNYECKSCPAGTFQTGEGMQSRNNCSLCAQGTFSNFSSATAVDDCIECADNASTSNGFKAEVVRCGGNESYIIAAIHSDELEVTTRELFHVMHTSHVDLNEENYDFLQRCFVHIILVLIPL
jgi:predicted outer membrane repeat protein